MAKGPTMNYPEYAADRQLKLSQLIRELRTSSELRTQFGTGHNDVAKKYGLALTDDEATRISEVASAKISDQLSGDELEAVSGGAPNGNCDCENGSGCGGGSSPQGW
jgi:hypothetical protein